MWDKGSEAERFWYVMASSTSKLILKKVEIYLKNKRKVSHKQGKWLEIEELWSFMMGELRTRKLKLLVKKIKFILKKQSCLKTKKRDSHKQD